MRQDDGVAFDLESSNGGNVRGVDRPLDLRNYIPQALINRGGLAFDLGSEGQILRCRDLARASCVHDCVSLVLIMSIYGR